MNQPSEPGYPKEIADAPADARIVFYRHDGGLIPPAGWMHLALAKARTGGEGGWMDYQETSAIDFSRRELPAPIALADSVSFELVEAARL